MAHQLLTGSLPLSPDFTQLAKLYAAGNRNFIHFYFGRLHQYELFYTRMIDDYVAQLENYAQVTAAAADEADVSEPISYESELLRAQADAAQIIEQAKLQAERILDDAFNRSGASSQTPVKSAQRKRA
ncbi:MAG: hypothetical protein DHS20C08_01280 [Rhodomicrobium sp.]|nr:MAG: hypothetical protein DHS20C08_01280 [Rhodomicrobium sp.]